MLRRILVAGLSLALGFGVAAGLLLYQGSAGGGRTVFALTRDLPAGAPLTPDAVTLVPAAVDPAQAAGLFSSGDRRQLLASRAIHQLSSGQLLQRSDVRPATAGGADALVALPIKEVPPVRPGDRVDLFALTGSGDQVVARPFASGVVVAAVTGDGLVLQVREEQELAFVYAAGTMRLAVAVSTGAAQPAQPAAIGSGDAALAAAGG